MLYLKRKKLSESVSHLQQENEKQSSAYNRSLLYDGKDLIITFASQLFLEDGEAFQG